MFQKACMNNRNSIYFVLGSTQTTPGQNTLDHGSGFMIAPGVIATVKHLTHVESDISNPSHSEFLVLRAPEIGKSGNWFEPAKLIAEDPITDIALLEISNPRSSECLNLEPNSVNIGTSCGSYGFPLSELIQTPQGNSWLTVERFQGSNISSFHKHVYFKGSSPSDAYEIDSLMYSGSSGCPAFLPDSKVIGMQSQSFVKDTRLAISILVPSMAIIRLASDNGINL